MNQEMLNEKLRNFLIDSREKSGLSQSDVAARSEVFGIGKTLDQRAVSRIETQPISADAIKIAGYLSAVGVQPKKYYELLTEFSFKKDVVVMSNYSGKYLSEKIKLVAEKLNSTKSDLSDFKHEYIDSVDLIDKFEQLGNFVTSLNRKPVIGCFGHFDAGKSTLINTIINESILPTNYQPATCVVNLLMHVDDKPTTLIGSVAIFSKGFKPHMIHSEKMVDHFLIEQGGVEILEKLGVHNHEEEIDNDAYIAIIFSEAEVLKNIWLLDTPGDLNSSDDADTEKALSGIELADGIVFVSNHTGFLKDSDLGFAANIIRQRPPADKKSPLNHLLFVQSHCHSEIKKDDVINVGRITFKRIKKQLDNLIFKAWLEDGFIECLPNQEELTSRTQPFWRENSEYMNGILYKISEMSDFLINNYEKNVDKHLTIALNNASSTIRYSIELLNKKKTDSIGRAREIEEKETRFREQSTHLIAKFNDIINSCSTRKKYDTESMSDYFKCNTSQEGLEALITDTYSDKKSAQSEIGNYISQLLTSKLERTLKTSGNSISGEVDILLERWQKATPSISDFNIDNSIGDFDLDISEFNSRAAFVGGLAGMSSLGAMALYVSSIASNLGAYILVGKAAGVLVSLGLAGSVSAVTSFVAAIGGPITIGIALAAAIGYLFYRLAGGSWQKSLAKKVSECIKKENVFDRIQSTIDKFWTSTEKSINAGLNELIHQTDAFIDKLKAQAATDYDKKELEKCISELSAVLSKLK